MTETPHYQRDLTINWIEDTHFIFACNNEIIIDILIAQRGGSCCGTWSQILLYKAFCIWILPFYVSQFFNVFDCLFVSLWNGNLEVPIPQGFVPLYWMRNTFANFWQQIRCFFCIWCGAFSRLLFFLLLLFYLSYWT